MHVELAAGVAVDEGASLAAVSVEVDEKLHVVTILDDSLLDGSDSWNLLFVWVKILSVHIKTIGVSSPLTSRHSVRVDAGDDLEHVVIKEGLGLLVLEVNQLVDDSLEHVLGWSLSAVNSAGQEDHWFLFKVGTL